MLTLLNDAAKSMFNYLGAVYPLQEGLIDVLTDIAGYRQLKPKELLLKPGEVSKELYFVHKGLLRCFYLRTNERTGEDREVCTWFMRENDTCVSVLSFYSQTPGKESIQALEACELFYITYDQLEMIYRKYMDFNFNGRVLTAKYLVEWTRQLENIRMLKGPERFAELLKRDPELLGRVPQKYLASYLGVRPDSLSRMLRMERKKK
jgi:CRP/FNR family transcriptional regulator, anaerobic regulatory protein